jgi:hypothetical protein
MEKKWSMVFNIVLCIGQKKRTDDAKAKRKGRMIQRPNEKDR